jgi:hypothetical protein
MKRQGGSPAFGFIAFKIPFQEAWQRQQMALPFYAQKYPTASVGYTKYGGIIKLHESLDFSIGTF